MPAILPANLPVKWRAILAGLLLIALAGCGLKDDLYLPDAGTESAGESEQSASQEEEDDAASS
ncbi:MAG: lipoprotein [Pseudomonadota bacterium]